MTPFEEIKSNFSHPRYEIFIVFHYLSYSVQKIGLNMGRYVRFNEYLEKSDRIYGKNQVKL